MTDYLRQGADHLQPGVASAFDGLSFWSSRFGLLLFEHLELKPDLRILDVGCGSGFPTFELAATHGPSSRITGVDVWKDAIRRAGGRRRTLDVDGVDLVMADGGRLPFVNAAFDLVVSNLGVNNFPDPRGAMVECARVCRAGGRMVLTTNLTGHMKEFYSVYRRVLRGFDNADYAARLDANESHRGSVASMTALLEDAGFKVERRFEDSFTMRYLDAAALFGNALTRYGFLAGWRSVVDAADETAVFDTLERELNKLAREQGGLQLSIPMLYLEGRR